jgi:hypothetical protein
MILLALEAMAASPDLSVRYARGSEPISRPWLGFGQHELGGSVGLPVAGRFGVALTGWGQLGRTSAFDGLLWVTALQSYNADPSADYRPVWPVPQGGAAVVGTVALARGSVSFAEEADLDLELSVRAGPEVRRIQWLEADDPGFEDDQTRGGPLPSAPLDADWVVGPRAGVDVRLGGEVGVVLGVDGAAWWVRSRDPLTGAPSAGSPDATQPGAIRVGPDRVRTAGHEVALSAGVSWRPARPEPGASPR